MASTDSNDLPLTFHRGHTPHSMDITRVCDGLYLSDFDSLTEEKIQARNISFIVNATTEKPNLDFLNVEFMKLDIYDSPAENIRQFMDVCADKIRAVKEAGGCSLIHCAFGVSRSVTICLAYLVKYEGKTLREAYFDLKYRRPIIRPNEGFWKQLISFEIDVKGKASVKMAVYPMGSMPDVYKSVRPGTNSFKVSCSEFTGKSRFKKVKMIYTVRSAYSMFNVSIFTLVTKSEYLYWYSFIHSGDLNSAPSGD